MIYGNAIIFKKIGKKRKQGKILFKKTLLKVLFFVSLIFFP